MDGLAAPGNILARARNGVAAREQSGTGDQKQSNELHHVVLLSLLWNFGDGKR